MRRFFVLAGFAILDIILVIAVWQRGLIKQIISPSPTPVFTSVPVATGESLNPPDELGKNFDQTKNPPRFTINSVDNNTKTVNLNVVWPNQIIELRVDSKITCGSGDIKIYRDGNKSDATIDGLLNEMQKTKQSNMIFSGLCTNANCTEIYKSCELYISSK
jgi:hypothetical protein